MTAAPLNPIILGKISSAYGIRGWLIVVSSTSKAESIFDYKPWFLKREKWQQIELDGWKRKKNDILIKIRSIEDREAARFLTTCEIFVSASQLPSLSNGSYYWKDLMGCQVVNIDGYKIGEIIYLMETGSNDVLVVKSNMKDDFGMQERLIPLIEGQVIKNVDITKRIIEVDWDPGF